MPDKKTRSLTAALDLAIEAFSTRPFEQVSMAEIAQGARCSTTTLYDVYGGKLGVFFHAMSQAPTVGGGVPRLVSIQGPPLRRLFILAIAHGDHMSRPETVMRFRNMMLQIDYMPDDVIDILRTRFERVWTIIRDTLAACQEAGDIVPDIDVDQLTCAFFALHGWRQILIPLNIRHTSVAPPRSPAWIAANTFIHFTSPSARAQLLAMLEEAPELMQDEDGAGAQVAL